MRQCPRLQTKFNVGKTVYWHDHIPRRRSTLAMRLRSFVESSTPAHPILPLAHTTGNLAFRSIMESRSIRCSSCQFFTDKDYLYLYYGRPAYRPKKTQDSVALEDFHLSAFLINRSMAPPPVRIFPFDSGAFCSGAYKGSINAKHDIESFQLSLDAESAARFVSAFFGNNAGYFNRHVSPHMGPSVLDFEVAALIELYSRKSKMAVDDRRASIEFQFDQSIMLEEGVVEAVIVNEEMAEDAEIRQFIEVQLNAKLIDYWCPRSDPADDSLLILNKAREYYVADGQI